MNLKEKIAARKYEREKRKKEKEFMKFNHRQEEMNTVYKNKKQKSDFKSLLYHLKLETYTKRLVAIVVFISIIDLQLSYLLAFLDKTQIAESLSNQICVTLLGTVLVYVIRAYFDTKAEKRDEMIKSGLIVDRSRKDNNIVIPKEVLEAKIQEIIDNSGLSSYMSAEEICEDLQTENPDDSCDNYV